MKPRIVSTFAAVLASGLIAAAQGAAPLAGTDGAYAVAQAMIPPTGMDDAQKPMPMNERYLKRFPQPMLVGDLIGVPVLDDDSSTLGFVRQVVHTPQGNVELIVSYSRWFGWFGRPVAVPLEAVAILGRELASLEMKPSEYAAAPTWQKDDATVLPDDVDVRVALGRR